VIGKQAVFDNKGLGRGLHCQLLTLNVRDKQNLKDKHSRIEYLILFK
jgi:hypothetical protein